jgi:hypothetical protein
MRLVGLSQEGPEHLFRELGGGGRRSLRCQDTGDGRVVLRKERVESVQSQRRCKRGQQVVPKSVKTKTEEVPAGRESEVRLSGLSIDVQERMNVFLVSRGEYTGDHAA